MSAPIIALCILGALVFGGLFGFVVGVLLTEEHVGRWVKDRYGDDL